MAARARVAAFPIPAPLRHPTRHTGRMAIRFTAQADTREECVEGLELLVAAGLVPVIGSLLRGYPRLQPGEETKLPAEQGRESRFAARADRRSPATGQQSPLTRGLIQCEA